jgi:hypothetical protein
MTVSWEGWNGYGTAQVLSAPVEGNVAESGTMTPVVVPWRTVKLKAPALHRVVSHSGLSGRRLRHQFLRGAGVISRADVTHAMLAGKVTAEPANIMTIASGDQTGPVSRRCSSP